MLKTDDEPLTHLGPPARPQQRDLDADRVWMTVPTTDRPVPAGVGTRLVREAALRAATPGVHVIETVVDGSTPAGGMVLTSLRDLVGSEVDAMTLRRAGSSVFVTLCLAAAPASRASAARDAHSRGPSGPRLTAARSHGAPRLLRSV